MKKLITTIVLLNALLAFGDETRPPIQIKEEGALSGVIASIAVNDKKEMIVTTGDHHIVFINSSGERTNALSFKDENRLPKIAIVEKISNTRAIVTVEHEIKLIDFAGNILSEDTLGKGKALYLGAKMIDESHAVVISGFQSPFTGRSYLYSNHFKIKNDRIKLDGRATKLDERAIIDQDIEITKDGRIYIRSNEHIVSYDVNRRKMTPFFTHPSGQTILEHKPLVSGEVLALTFDGELCLVKSSKSYRCKETGVPYPMAHGMIQLDNQDVLVNLEHAVKRYSPDLTEKWSIDMFPSNIQALTLLNKTVVGVSYSFNLKKDPEKRFDVIEFDTDGKVIKKIVNPDIGGIIPPATRYDESTYVIGDAGGKLRFYSISK